VYIKAAVVNSVVYDTIRAKKLQLQSGTDVELSHYNKWPKA